MFSWNSSPIYPSTMARRRRLRNVALGRQLRYRYRTAKQVGGGKPRKRRVVQVGVQPRNAPPTMASPDQMMPGMTPTSPVSEEELKMNNAVAFLQHPKVVNASLHQKMSFLQSKGLTNEEICKAFRKIDARSSDADAIEKGLVSEVVSPPQLAPAPTPYPNIPQTQTIAYVPHSQQGITYYPMQPPYSQPVQQSSRFPAYSALAAALLLAGGGFAYVYRRILLEKLSFLKSKVETSDNVSDAIRSLQEQSQEMKETLAAVTRHREATSYDNISESIVLLQKQSEEMQQTLTSLNRKLDTLSKDNMGSADSNQSAVQRATLSPAVQALLEGASSSVPVIFDLERHTAMLESAFEQVTSNNQSSVVERCVPVLKIYVKNLLNHGVDRTQFHRINLSSQYYEQNVHCCQGADDILRACGFRLSEGFYVWQAPRGGPSSDDYKHRFQVLNIALERLEALGTNFQMVISNKQVPLLSKGSTVDGSEEVQRHDVDLVNVDKSSSDSASEREIVDAS